MNLPNLEDKQIAATSIGLSEQQTNELSRLKTGVAVVYQKGWEEPVQCQITRFEGISPYLERENSIASSDTTSFISYIVKAYTTDEALYRSQLLPMLDTVDISGYRKIQLMSILSDDQSSTEEICAKIFVLIVGEKLFLKASKLNELHLFNNFIRSGLKRIVGNDGNIDIYLDMYIKGCSLMNKTAFYENWLIQNSKINKNSYGSYFYTYFSS